MNGRKLCQVALALAAIGAVAFATTAEARTRVGVGVYVGPGWGYGPGWGPGWGGPGWGPGWGPYGSYYGPYYAPGYYAPPAVVAVPAPNPPQYIEQGSDGNPALTDGTSPNAWWYFCNQPQGYYPYVKECPGGWQREQPRAPSSAVPVPGAPTASSALPGAAS
ncbi:hypothetical protein [Cupriavidus agavae]|uniref:Proline-rich region n=1 Tax=Cupriavidus agavae TaxID=1001822 RepID=A0A4Q7SB38_9BURK|nr:hypothetical protein [Cupriavidus agavae]RZT43057.1 hypothetical protein EV147_2104 [Cupriavidus agavae]